MSVRPEGTPEASATQPGSASPLSAPAAPQPGPVGGSAPPVAHPPTPIEDPPPLLEVRARRAVSPLTWFFILLLVVVPFSLWLLQRPTDEQPTPTLVATRDINAYSQLAPGDLRMEVRPK